MKLKNKILVTIKVPEILEEYDVYIPINKRIGNIIMLLNNAINELSKGEFEISKTNKLYNATTKERYNKDILLIDTNIRNGTQLILLS